MPNSSGSNDRLQCRRTERGAAAAVVVLFTVALMAVAGLVIDGGYALGAQRRAMNTAEQAARVGADALDEAALRDGNVRVDSAAATAAAHSYLESVGADGSVRVNGDRVTVTVTAEQDTTLLSAVGIGSLRVRASATAISIDEDSRP